MRSRKLSAREAQAVEKAVVLGLSIQHKFRPEPLYKQMGRGHMKSSGVDTLAKINKQASGAKSVAR